MAGETLHRIRTLGHDLAHSWYFRIWALLWLLFALVVFSALIILSQNAESAMKQEQIVEWIDNATQITFPRFHLRTEFQGNETFVNVQCNYGTQALNQMQCASWRGMPPPPLSQCIALNSDSITVANHWGAQEHNSRINCQINTTGTGPQGNTMIAFELEGNNVFAWGGMPFMSTWFAPNDMTWIFLEENIFQLNGKSPQIQLWKKDLIYHSTASSLNYYNMTTMLGSFFVRHLEPMDTYNGWMTVGDIGGVAFFMVVLHTAVMIIIGLFMSNSSSFLTGEEHH